VAAATIVVPLRDVLLLEIRGLDRLHFMNKWMELIANTMIWLSSWRVAGEVVAAAVLYLL
jgi:hypothetical protein